MRRRLCRRGAPAALVALAPALALAATAARADTLKEALAAAYSDNPTILAARAQQRATDQNVPVARADALPSATLDLAFNENVIQNSQNALFVPDRQLSGQLQLGLPIFSAGRVRNSIRGAETRVRAGRADLLATETSVFSQTVAAYMDVILNQAIVGLTLSNVSVLNVNLRATSDRFEIGDLTRTDVAQSQSRLALGESDLRSARADLINARETYVRLTGQAPGDLAAPPALPNLPDSVEAAVEVALQNNPDLAAARLRSEAAGFDIRVAGAGRYPTISLVTGGQYLNYLNSIAGTQLITPANTINTATIGARVSVPLFQGGRPAALERQAQAQSLALQEQLVAVERMVVANTRAAFTSWQAALAIIDSNQVAVDATRLGLEGVRAENTVGNRTILDILNAQQELLRAEVQLVTARRNAYVAGFNLLAAMGEAGAEDLNLELGGDLYDPVAPYRRSRNVVWDFASRADPTGQAGSTVDTAPQTGDIPDEDQIRQDSADLLPSRDDSDGR